MKRAMTLVEVMTTLGLFFVLLALTATLFSSMKQAYEYQEGRILLQRRARVAMARITPLVVTAIPPDELTPAIIAPPVVEGFNAPASTSLVFSSPLDLLGRAGSPGPRTLRSFRYEITQVGTDIVLRRVSEQGRPQGQPSARVLARRIEDFQVRHVQLNAVNVEIGVRLENSDKEFRLETLVQIPFYSN